MAPGHEAIAQQTAVPHVGATIARVLPPTLMDACRPAPAPAGACPVDAVYPPPGPFANVLDVRAAIDAVLAAAAGPPDDSITRERIPEHASHEEALSPPAPCERRLADSAGGSCTDVPLQEPLQPPLQQVLAGELHPAARGPDRPIDRELLLRATTLRVASFRQLHALVLPGQHFSGVGRRAAVLQKLGFATVWEDRLPQGGHPRYVVPTAGGIAWAHAELVARAARTPHAALVRHMLGGASRSPLQLAPFTAPTWFPHQRATNELVTRFTLAAPLGVTWASAWHRPLPNAIDGLPLPQPDFVLVRQQGTASALVFGEVDRGHEPLATFARVKSERYAGLAASPAVLEQLTGFRSFEVWVVVDNAQQPVERLTALHAATQRTYGASMLRFTVFPWALDAPTGAIWFDVEHAPAHASLHRLEHANLIAP